VWQIFRRHDQRREELLQPADVLEHAERRRQHAVPRVRNLPLLRLHFADRHVRRSHGSEDRRTYGQFRDCETLGLVSLMLLSFDDALKTVHTSRRDADRRSYNPGLAKVKVDPDGKNQGQRSNGSNRRAVTDKRTQTDATECIISPATRSTIAGYNDPGRLRHAGSQDCDLSCQVLIYTFCCCM